MRSILIITLLAYAFFGQISAQAPILTWSIGDVELDCANNTVCYSMMAQSNTSSTQLADATKRYFYDPTIMTSPTIANIQNSYQIQFSPTPNPTLPTIGDEFGFATDIGAFLRLDVTPNDNNLIQVGNGSPAHVFDLCFTLTASGADLSSFCSPFVFDYNHKQKYQDFQGTTLWPSGTPAPVNPGGIQWDFGYFNSDAGIATQVYRNDDINVLIGADDEAIQYLWEGSPAFDGIISTQGEPVGTGLNTSCPVGCNSCVATSFSQSFDICEGGTINVGTNSYNTTGNYLDTLVNVNGCDSIVYTYLSVFDCTPPILSNVSCNDNGSTTNDVDDFISFSLEGLEQDLYSTYTVTAVQAGNPVVITLSDGNPTGDILYGFNMPFRLPNGSAGDGNVTLTITDTATGNISNITLNDPGTCNVVCPAVGDTTSVTYSYTIPYTFTSFTDSILIPKFDNLGGSRILTDVNLVYNNEVSTNAIFENRGSSSNNVIFTLWNNFSILFNNVAFDNNIDSLLTGTTILPPSVSVPPTGQWLGDVSGSTLQRMTPWYSNYLRSFINPNSDPRWVTNVTGNLTDDDDIVYLSKSTGTHSGSTNFNTNPDLISFIGAGYIPIKINNEVSNSYSSGAAVNYSATTKGTATVSVTYSFICACDTMRTIQNLAICEGESITIGSNTYNTSGSYIDTLISSTSCDSIVTTNLVVNPIIETTLNFITCNPTEVGTVVNTLVGSNGCDSIVTTITSLPISSDSDGDGILDYCDLDDDNDGILDTDECSNSITDLANAFSDGSLLTI